MQAAWAPLKIGLKIEAPGPQNGNTGPPTSHKINLLLSMMALPGNGFKLDVLFLLSRLLPAAANTPTNLVVAGGRLSRMGDEVATVEVLNIETLQWSTASSLPQVVVYPQMTTCGGCIYLANSGNEVSLCPVEDLLSDDGSVWTRLANIPAPNMCTLTTLRGHVLAVGGYEKLHNF